MMNTMGGEVRRKRERGGGEEEERTEKLEQKYL